MLLDFKHSNETGHKNLTGLGQKHVLEFARVLEEKRIPMIARHVVVPGITDDETHLQDLGKLLAGFRNLKGLEVLPYHTMGKVSTISWLILSSGAGGNMDGEKAKEARNVILRAFQKERQNLILDKPAGNR